MWFRARSTIRLNPPPTSPRPPPPRSQAAPLDLTPAMAVRPRSGDWRRANRLFEHPTGCRCSTCRLAADLGRAVRDQEKLP